MINRILNVISISLYITFKKTLCRRIEFKKRLCRPVDFRGSFPYK